MPRLRNSQIWAIEKGQRDCFRRQTVERIGADHPEFFDRLGEEGVGDFVDKALSALDRWGIDTVGAATIMIEVMVAVGLEFERCPDQAGLLEILERPTLPGPLKARFVFEIVNERTQGRDVTPLD